MGIPFVHIEAKGTYRELGRAVGEGARELVKASVEFFAENFAGITEGRLSFAEAELLARPYGELARRWLPQHVEELEGVAEAAGVPFSQLLVLNCGEELTAAEPVAGQPACGPPAKGRSAKGSPAGDRCTAVAVAAGGRHVVGHNMDWYVIDATNSVLFDLTILGGTRLMGIAGAPYLLMLGMTSEGLGNVSNSVHSTDNVVGVPNAFVRRWSLEAPTLAEARTRGTLAARARGTNHLLADTTGRLWDLETSASTSSFRDHSAAGFAAHTNHYVSADMGPFEGEAHDESRVRLATAEQMLAEGLDRGDDPVDLIASVLRCHDPAPAQAICGHPDPGEPAAQQGMTVSSMICDLDERRLYVCAGPPCENPYRVFAM